MAKIAVKVVNDDGKLVRDVAIEITSEDGISSAQVIGEVDDLIKEWISTWIYLEGATIVVESLKTA